MLSIALLAQSDAVRTSLGQLLSGVPQELSWFIGVMIFGFLASVGYSVYGLGKLRQAVESQVAALGAAGEITDDVKRQGQTAEALDRWRQAAENLTPDNEEITRSIEQSLVQIRDINGATRYRFQGAISTLWNRETVARHYLNLEYVEAVPNLLTALGLIGTFLAIALGLGGLRETPGGAIDGVTKLIENLGGKFIASIIALLLALVFQLLDLLYLQPQIKNAIARLRTKVVEVFPEQTDTQQFADLLELTHRQEKAIANISSDVVTSFGQLFSSDLLPSFATALAGSVQSEIGPTMREVATGIRSLDEGIKRLESGKQESIGAELRGLTASIERSLIRVRPILAKQPDDPGDVFIAGLAHDEAHVQAPLTPCSPRPR